MSCSGCTRRREWLRTKIEWIKYRDRELFTTLYPQQYLPGEIYLGNVITRVVESEKDLGVYVVFGRENK